MGLDIFLRDDFSLVPVDDGERARVILAREGADAHRVFIGATEDGEDSCVLLNVCGAI